MNEFVNCSALAIIVDETSDDEGRFVLNVFFLQRWKRLNRVRINHT